MTSEVLKSFVNYDSQTGIFTWKIDRHGKAKAGDKTGLKDGQGHLQIKIMGKRYSAHRIGKLPDQQIDHINGIRTDNRISNLRDVSRLENMKNMKCHRNGHLLGTTRFKDKWVATSYINGKAKYLGLFKTQREAHEKYLQHQNG